MAKLPRVTAKIFASNAAPDDIGQFGSALTGDKVTTGNIAEIQALPAYEVGWRGAVLSTRNFPTLQEMNGLQKTFSQQIAYLLNNGVAEYDSATSYYKGDIIKVLDNSGAPTLKYSLTDNNLGNGPSNSTYWGTVNLIDTSNLANIDLSNLSSTGQAKFDAKANLSALSSHIDNKNNPHAVTKGQVGLGNVDNTSDLNKPISTAMQTALNAKANLSALSSHIDNKNNPHAVTKAQVGLGNVDNTSDLNKPISTAMQTALNAKANDNAVMHLTGDETIAGMKTFSDNVYSSKNANPNFIVKSTGADWTATSTINIGLGGFRIQDKNSQVGAFVAVINGDDTRRVRIECNDKTKSTSAEIQLGYNSSNVVYTSCPACAAVNSIITTTGINKASNGYLKMGNGIIMQWGRATISSSSEHTITFSIAFTSATSYTIVKNYQSSKTSSNATDAEVSFYSMSATTAKTYSSSPDTSQISWLAIGY